MCGSVNSPSIVGRLAKVTAEARIGSFVAGSPKIGVTVLISEEKALTTKQAEQFESRTGESAPDYFYNVVLVKGVSGDDTPESLKAMAGQIVLFRDEFELID